VIRFLRAMAVLVLCPALAAAQVTINPAALVQLAGLPALHPAPPAAAAPIVHHYIRHRRAAVAKPAPPKIVQAAAKLPAPAVAIPSAPPAHVTPKPLGPVRIEFAAGSAALPAGTAAAIAPYCHSAARIGINARAAGEADDPSVAMRLSLQRAMAVRDALTACGVPAQNIIPRALGDVPGGDDNETVLGGGEGPPK